MSWGKREPVQNMVFLGDGEGDRKKVGGLLVDMQQNRLYPTKMDYSLVQADGEVIIVGGSASLGRQIGPDDVGKFIKAEFKGWGKSANGKFKEIEVNVWDGPPNDAMLAWPRFTEFSKGPAKKPAAVRAAATDDDVGRPETSFPAALEDESDDGLPF